MKLTASRALQPGQGALGLPELAQYLGISPATLTRLRRDARPRFPEPIKLLDGTRLQWITAEVNDWIKARAEVLRRSA